MPPPRGGPRGSPRTSGPEAAAPAGPPEPDADDVTLALSGFSDLFEGTEVGDAGDAGEGQPPGAPGAGPPSLSTRDLLVVPSGPAVGDGRQNLRSKFHDAFKKGISTPMDLLESYEASVPGPKKAPMDSLFQYGTCRQESHQKRRRKKLLRG